MKMDYVSATQYSCGPMIASSWYPTLIRLCLSYRLRCHVLESAKPAIKTFKDNPMETMPSEQQELNIAVSFGVKNK